MIDRRPMRLFQCGTLAVLIATAACSGTSNPGDASADRVISDAVSAVDGSDVIAPHDGGPADAQISDTGVADNGPDVVTLDAGTDAPSVDAGTDVPGTDSGTPDGGTTPVGAGQPGYVCPSTGTVVTIHEADSPATVATAFTGAPAGATICVRGYHRLQSTAVLKANQTIIGVSGTDARLSGAIDLPDSGWHAMGTGVWYYDGPGSMRAANIQVNLSSSGPAAVFPVSTFQDDVFYNDQRMLRVLQVSDLADGGPTPAGQRENAAETGRFYFDSTTTHRIYINRNPIGANVEMATLDTVVQGAGGADNVTIENITIEKALTTSLNVAGRANWQVTDTTIRFAHNFGLAFANGTDNTHRAVFTRDLITNNGQYGITTSVESFLTFQDCELSWNNIANYRSAGASGPGPYFAAGSSKFWASAGTSMSAPGVIINNLDSHHNIGAGLWFDGHNQYVVIHGGHYHHNEGPGIMYEISCDADISGAEFDHNGLPILNGSNPSMPTGLPDVASAGIFVSDSNTTIVHDNVFHDNALGAVMVGWQGHGGMAGRCNLGTTDTDISNATMNDAVRNNQIYVCAGHSGAAASNYSLWSRMDVFSNNQYHLASLSGMYWRDAAGVIGWTAWQAAHQDTTSTPTPGCSYP